MTRKTPPRPTPKITDAFKRKLVSESLMPGVTVPQVAKRHGVPSGQIYTWRSDERFQPDAPEQPVFNSVAVMSDPSPQSHVEIMLENGRKLSLNGCTDAAFILTLAQGLAA